MSSMSKGARTIRRFAPTREFDASAPTFQNGYERDKPAFGRDYSRDEIIANYNYFIRQIAPVAERAGVAIAFHPDDVPVYDKLAGVPRIFNNFSEIKERLAAAQSPNVGMILCCGVWIEGGAGMGCSVEDAVRYFVSNHRVWEIHFRNVSSTLPKFNEAFMDNGVYDMYKIMKTVYDSGYRELIHYDHTPDMVGALNSLRREQHLEPLPFDAARASVSHGSTRLVKLGFPDADPGEFAALQRRLREVRLLEPRSGRVPIGRIQH